LCGKRGELVELSVKVPIPILENLLGDAVGFSICKWCARAGFGIARLLSRR